MCRGNRGATVFGSEGDVGLFLKTLGEVCARTDWKVHAWVLMSTHYHLLLETPNANLVEGMKWFQGTFTQRMNAMQKTWGHLFQGRYKAKVIEQDEPEYFRRVATYIHLNPAAAGLLDRETGRLESYAWSSYPHYLQAPSRRPDFLDVAEVLYCQHLKDTVKGRRLFREMMQNDAEWAMEKGSEFYSRHFKCMDRGWVHGSKEFRRKMSEHLLEQQAGREREIHDREQRRDLAESAVQAIIQEGCKRLRINPSDLVRLKKCAPEKILLATYIKENYSTENREISRLLHMGDRSLVGRSRSIVERKKDFARRYRSLKRALDETKTTQITSR
jgi:REP element-mobilizing transposase RayT